MNWTDLFAAAGKAADLVRDLGIGIINLLGKGKLDVTEVERMRFEYERAVQQLDFQLKQAGLWMQEKLIAMEQVTGARWRPPLILASGSALILAALNNILAACYFDWANPIDIASPEMGLLAGMFLLLVTGSTDLLLRWFNGSKKPDADNSPAAKTKTGG